MCSSESLSEFFWTQGCLPGSISAPLQTRYSALFGQSASVHALPTFREIEFV